MYKRLFPSVEGIREQDGSFFKDLVATLNQLKHDTPNINRWASNEEEAIAKVIHAHTKANVYVELNETYTAFYNEEFNTQAIEFLKSGKTFEVIAAVNYNTGKLEGAFTKLKTKVYLTYELLSSKFTTEEQAAVILHEVGHLYTLFDFIGKIYTTNFALKDIQDVYTGEANIEKRRIVLKNIKDRADLKDLEVEELANCDNKETVSVVVLDRLKEKASSQLGCEAYDVTAFEFLADQYATKQGAGRALMTALDKLGSNSRHSATSFYFVELIKAIELTGTILIFPVIGTIFFLSLFTLIGLNRGKSRYDEIGDRLARIRMQIIQRLKDNKLPEGLRKQAREDLLLIDEKISLANNRVSFLSQLADKLFSTPRKRIKAQELQMQLEKLALNDLFIKAFDLERV